jgi:hypothetical protein
MQYGPERGTPPPPEHGRYARRGIASSLRSSQGRSFLSFPFVYLPAGYSSYHDGTIDAVIAG